MGFVKTQINGGRVFFISGMLPDAPTNWLLKAVQLHYQVGTSQALRLRFAGPVDAPRFLLPPLSASSPEGAVGVAPSLSPSFASKKLLKVTRGLFSAGSRPPVPKLRGSAPVVRVACVSATLNPKP